MLSEPAAAHRTLDRTDPSPDRSMQILQYATAVAAMVAAALLAVIR